jgi:autotransporter-associated beta strand protein
VGPSTANWVYYDGFTSLDWQGNFAVFQGATGTVTVDGQQTVSGMQFMTDGYHLVAGTNGSLNIENRNGSTFAVRTDNGVTATLDVPLTGAGTLNKLDVGTLVLNGANSYTGGTQLNGGTLVLGNDSALGTGSLTTASGTTLDSNTAVKLGNAVAVNGALTLAGSNDLTLNGVVSGNGGLVKNGAGVLTLGNVNTFDGGVQLNAGRLIVGAAGSLGVGALTAANGTSLDTLGALNGQYRQSRGEPDRRRQLRPDPQWPDQRYRESYQTGLQYAGPVWRQQFQRWRQPARRYPDLGHAWSLGSGALTVNGASLLDTKSAFALDNAIQLNAALTLTGSNDLALNGVVNGTGV